MLRPASFLDAGLMSTASLMLYARNPDVFTQKPRRGRRRDVAVARCGCVLMRAVACCALCDACCVLMHAARCMLLRVALCVWLHVALCALRGCPCIVACKGLETM